MQAVPYARAALGQPTDAVHRLQRLCDAVPQAWLHGRDQTQALREVCLAAARPLDKRDLTAKVRTRLVGAARNWLLLPALRAPCC